MVKYHSEADMSNQAKIREEAAKLNPIDDIMFRKMAEDREFCEEIIRVILGEPDLIVTENTVEWVGTNLQGRSVRLDTKCTMSDGRIVNVEVQRADNDDHQKRVRYNGAILTTNTTDPGDKFENVPNVIVIYLSQFDIFEKGKTLYHVDRVLRETKDVLDNGYNEIYVNTKVDDGTDVSELMKLFVHSDAYNDKFPKMSERKRLFKEGEEGRITMSETLLKMMNDSKTEGIREGIQEGIREGKKEGKKEGIREGVKMLGSLIQKLISENRSSEIEAVVNDEAYRNQLYAEFGIIP